MLAESNAGVQLRQGRVSQANFALLPLEFIDDGHCGFFRRVYDAECVSLVDREAQGTVVAGGVLM